uniref:Uncharacterized protein n=1 Tax=Plectus sambesii TaxID=2011161 RepID=A0A914XMJ5_9BILA
ALEIPRNGLQRIPKSISSLRNLTRFDASYNALSSLGPTKLVELEKLRVIILDGNAYTNLNYARFPTRLTRLSVRDNVISVMFQETDDERELIYEAIDLSGNKIEFLADTVLLNSVRMVNLSSNLIRIISDGALAQKNRLDWVDLTNNRLNDIELKGIAVYNPGVGRVRIFAARNPLRCSCALEWMIDEHRQASYQVAIADLDKVTCTPLRSSIYVSLSSIDPSTLLCEYRGAVCHEDCTLQCCRSPNCSCRSICPKQCTCWASREGRNIVDCSNAKPSFDIRSIPNRTTEAHLSGSHFPSLKKGDFLEKTRLTFLNLSLSSIQRLEEEAFQVREE